MRTPLLAVIVGLAVLIGIVVVSRMMRPPAEDRLHSADEVVTRLYQPRRSFDTSGANLIYSLVPAWSGDASLEEIADIWRGVGQRHLELSTSEPGRSGGGLQQRMDSLMTEALVLNYEGRPYDALESLELARAIADQDDRLATEFRFTMIFFQGVTALRCGENDNCIACRGEKSCILPLHPSAVHTDKRGSRLAVGYFTEYLEQFPDDIGVRWLLNLAHMTLGEHPQAVDPRFQMDMSHEEPDGNSVTAFRDIGADVGLNRLNQAGGGILDDFDADGFLDVVSTSMDPTQSMAFFRNRGGGAFDEQTMSAGLSDQLGGLYCVQTDYDNDGLLDVYIPRGAWLQSPVRPSLMRNNGDGTFSDVTSEAGLLAPVNSVSAAWADFDNDGNLDLHVCCERQPNRLYRNLGNGTFVDVAEQAGAQGNGTPSCMGATWLDIDNDGDCDLFVTYIGGSAQLLRNNGDQSFSDVTATMGIDGPERGFSCWSWDFDNDGWTDIFATCYDLDLNSAVRGILGQPHDRQFSRLYRNADGRRFEDVTRTAGLDMVFGTMGSNFGDIDNDGFLDMYLGTGDPRIETLVPNRMFRNVGGKFFAEVTTSSRTGHLQKGHGVGFGDWDRDGDNDLFIEMGGAIPGDVAHNILFENPGNENRSLTVRLVGTVSPRNAIGARIELVTAGPNPQTIHRTISSGSSFGANPLEQTIGLGSAERVESLTIRWPASGPVQTLHDIPVGQSYLFSESGSVTLLPSR